MNTTMNQLLQLPSKLIQETMNEDYIEILLLWYTPSKLSSTVCLCI